MMDFYEEPAPARKVQSILLGLSLLGLGWALYRLGYMTIHS